MQQAQTTLPKPTSLIKPHGDGVFSRAEVDRALITAGDRDDASDSDIQRLTNLQIDMAHAGLRTVDVDTLDQSTRALLTCLVNADTSL